MIIRTFHTRIFRERDGLMPFIIQYLPKLRERVVVVVTSKIVALAEGRTAAMGNQRSKARLIRSESQWARQTKYTWLTVKDGSVMASAGIDESNADGKLILLPRDSFRSAQIIRQALCRAYSLRQLGVIVTDSRVAPLRAGITGVALGYAGFHGLREYRGVKDIFGRKLTMTHTNVADSLAGAAVVIMGEAAERRPLALISQAPVEFCERVTRRELLIDIRDDMYRPLFASLNIRRANNKTPLSH